MTNPFLYKPQMDTTYINPATSPTTWKDQGTNGLDLSAKAAGEPLFSYGNAASGYRPVFIFDEVNDYFTGGDDDDFEPDYGDLTVEWYGYVNSGSVSENLIHKGTPSGNRIHLQVSGTGKARWRIEDASANQITADSTTSINTGEIMHIFGVTDRDSATGHKIYVNSGTAEDTADPTGATDVITGAGNPFVLGTRSSAPGTDDNFGGGMLFVRYYNRGLSGSEVAAKIADPFGDLSTADKYGSMAELMPNQVDRLLDGGPGGSNWVNVNLDSFDDDGDLSISAIFFGLYCRLPVASMPMTAGNRYRLQFDVANISADWDIKDFTGVQTFGTVTANGTNQWIEFTVDTGITGGLRIVSTGSDALDFDNFSLIRVGCVAEYLLKHTNAYSPLALTKARFLPRREPIMPNQIVGVSGGGQVKVADLGTAVEMFPQRILRVADAVDTNFRGFFADSAVNYSEQTFTYVDEEATERTVRLWPVGKFPTPVQGKGGLWSLDFNVREEIS